MDEIQQRIAGVEDTIVEIVISVIANDKIKHFYSKEKRPGNLGHYEQIKPKNNTNKRQ